jgi:hypothetical protein
MRAAILGHEVHTELKPTINPLEFSLRFGQIVFCAWGNTGKSSG